MFVVFFNDTPTVFLKSHWCLLLYTFEGKKCCRWKTNRLKQATKRFIGCFNFWMKAAMDDRACYHFSSKSIPINLVHRIF